MDRVQSKFNVYTGLVLSNRWVKTQAFVSPSLIPNIFGRISNARLLLVEMPGYGSSIAAEIYRLI